jgi:hypothetical protein
MKLFVQFELVCEFYESSPVSCAPRHILHSGLQCSFNVEHGTLAKQLGSHVLIIVQNQSCP